MDHQALDPVDMDGKCVNPHEAVKEALTMKTARARLEYMILVFLFYFFILSHYIRKLTFFLITKYSKQVCAHMKNVFRLYHI